MKDIAREDGQIKRIADYLVFVLMHSNSFGVKIF